MVQLATENLLIVMLDEDTGNTYMRSVDSKGISNDGDLRWGCRICIRSSSHGGIPVEAQTESFSKVMGRNLS